VRRRIDSRSESRPGAVLGEIVAILDIRAELAQDVQFIH
jgi:hypothetical protein